MTCIPEVIARWEVKYRRRWRAMLRSGDPADLAAFRLEYDQPPIPPHLLERAYHLAVHRAAELQAPDHCAENRGSRTLATRDPEKEASRAWLRTHGQPGDLEQVTAWPPT